MATFGLSTTSGAMGVAHNGAGGCIGGYATLSENGVVTGYSVYLNNVGYSANHVRCYLLNDSGGNPGSLVSNSYSSEGDVLANTLGWVECSLASLNLNAGNYWLCAQFETADTYAEYNTTTGAHAIMGGNGTYGTPTASLSDWKTGDSPSRTLVMTATYTTAPTVTDVTPDSGAVAGGTTVVLTGTNFTGATQVKFGAANAPSFTVDSDTQITVTSPPGIG